MTVLGVDAYRKGWIAVGLNDDGAFGTAFVSPLPDLAPARRVQSGMYEGVGSVKGGCGVVVGVRAR